MDRNREPPPSPSQQQQQIWLKIALSAALLLLLAGLNYVMLGGADQNKDVPAERLSKSTGASAGEVPSISDKNSPRKGARKSSKSTADDTSDYASDSRSPDAVDPDLGQHGALTIHNVRVTDEDGHAVYRGDVDLRPTLDRIERGDRLRFSHDGIVFENREHRLPTKPNGYYHEFVQPTPGDKGPGGQRLVIGDNGEVYYSSDHYKTFRRIR